MEKEIDEIEMGPVPERDLGDISSLKRSITEHGLLQPIVINQNNELIAGRRRLQACKELGWKKIPVTVVSTESDYDMVAKALVENIQRKEMSWQEEVTFIDELDKLMKAKHGEIIQGQRTDITPAEEAWSANKTAELLNTSPTTVRKSLIIAKEIKEDEKIGKIRTKTQAWREHIKKEKMKDVGKQKTKGKYDVINVYARWTYPNGKDKSEIEEIEIPSSNNSIVFLWTNVSHIFEAFEVLESWGFEFKNLITWHKPDIGGLGHWGRVVTEHALMGIKGKPAVDFDKIENFVEGKRPGAGGLPVEFYNMINDACPGSKLDIFGSEPHEGWDLRPGG